MINIMFHHRAKEWLSLLDRSVSIRNHFNNPNYLQPVSAGLPDTRMIIFWVKLKFCYAVAERGRSGSERHYLRVDYQGYSQHIDCPVSCLWLHALHTSRLLHIVHTCLVVE